MILPGKTVISRGLLRGLLSPAQQIQPCGVDLSLYRILRWSGPGIIDFDNTYRKKAPTEEIPFLSKDRIHLENGAYLVEFNETVAVPLDVMGQIFARSSLLRSGAAISAGVMDAGYEGVIGTMLRVYNPNGLILHRDAKLAQIVFHEMEEKVDGYSGIYQKSERM